MALRTQERKLGLLLPYTPFASQGRGRTAAMMNKTESRLGFREFLNARVHVMHCGGLRTCIEEQRTNLEIVVLGCRTLCARSDQRKLVGSIPMVMEAECAADLLGQRLAISI